MNTVLHLTALVTSLTASVLFCSVAGLAGNVHKHHPAQLGPGAGCLHWLFHAHHHLQNTIVPTHL